VSSQTTMTSEAVHLAYQANPRKLLPLPVFHTDRFCQNRVGIVTKSQVLVSAYPDPCPTVVSRHKGQVPVTAPTSGPYGNTTSSIRTSGKNPVRGKEIMVNEAKSGPNKTPSDHRGLRKQRNGSRNVQCLSWYSLELFLSL
jgi:hypothetical protein